MDGAIPSIPDIGPWSKARIGAPQVDGAISGHGPTHSHSERVDF